ncbi:phosphate ABC transporter permease PstA [Leucobacter weissii]|uniref:Phosphate transport system permease protein PstA n=1 Tax=Leucobacter weissii TaxID=1983706 RepID=A0A939S968_9MICO|nr:phosphate ABC transporter permease PstA [Leucobacter weissii]MBO1902831.1 phosphate ABC transporter permease PstA [Leucobacter weissii]
MTDTLIGTESSERDHETAPAELPARHAAPPVVAGTVTPDVSDVEEGERRDLRGVRAEDAFNLLGALAAGIAIATLLFGWIAPLTGPIGWFIVAFLSFLAVYSYLVRLGAGWQEVKDRIATTLFVSAAVILVGALLFVISYALIRGSEALPHLNFFTQDMELAGPLDPLDVGGILHAILGTLIQISIALAITIPLGVLTALYLNEVGGRFARFVRTIADAMTALPSIVAGLFIYAAVILLITNQRSGFAAALAITVMMLPIVIRASDVVLRLVAGNLREAAYALGATRWRTVWHVVLPTARSGLVTAVILGTARGIGETSPVLLTSGMTNVTNLNPFEGAMISLPLQVFDFVRSPEPNMIARGFGTAAVLLLLVLALFTIARMIGGRGPGQLSKRGERRVKDASKRDMRRMSRAAEASLQAAPSAQIPPDPQPAQTATDR